MKDVIIGIDTGGAHFRIGTVAMDGSLSGFEKISNGKFGGVDGVSMLVDEVRGYMERWKPDGNMKAVTIGIPGTVSRDKTTVFSALYVPFFAGFDLKHRLEDIWGIPVFIEKDTNILMFRDMFFHREDICFEGDRMLVGLYYGSAVANAFYFQGQFYDGKNGVAGEVAHNLIRGLEEYCVCGNIGCQCLRCGGKYLEWLAAERYPDMAFEQLFLAHGQGAPVREFVKDMAVPVIEIANILDPKLIFIAGSTTDMAGFPWGLLEQYIRENTRHPIPADNLRFIFTTHSRESGVLGVGLYDAYRLGLVELQRKETGTRDLFALSIMCGDLLNLKEGIRMHEKAGADMIHFDIMNTTFINTTMLLPLLLPAVHRATHLPVDVHVMVDRLERFVGTLLPYRKDTYMSIHIESTKGIQNLLKATKQAGGRLFAALNPGTSLCMVEEVVPLVDIMLVLLCSAGSGPEQDIDEQLSHKLQKAKMMLEQYGKPGAPLEVDGNVSFENARRTKSLGANVFVLGTASIYNDRGTVPENMGRSREYLENN